MSFEHRALRSHPGVEIVTPRHALDAFSVMLVVACRCTRARDEAMLVGPVDVHVDEDGSRADHRVLRVAPDALAEIALELDVPSSNLVVVEREIASTASSALFEAFFDALDHEGAPAQMQRLLDACVATARARDEMADVAVLGRWGFVGLFRHQVGMALLANAVTPAAALGRLDARRFNLRAQLARNESAHEVPTGTRNTH